MKWRIIIKEQSGKDLTDYQVRVEVTDPDFFKECTGQKFVEFYDSDMQTLLNHYTEEFDPENNKAVFWVKVPSIPANSTKTIYLNVNTERTEDLSNPEAVFDFWDDFESLDNWDVHVSAGNVRVENSLLIISGSNSATAGINGVRSKTMFSYPIAVDFKLIVTAPTTNWAWKMWGVFDTPLTAGHLFGGDNAIGRNQEATPYFGTMKNGNLTTVNVDAITDWHVETIIWMDNKAKNLWDYQLKAEITENIPTVQLYIALGVGNNAGAEAIKCDFVRVRKYTEPEPSVMVVKVRATPTLDLKKMIANCLAGKKAKILDNYPIIRLKSGDTVIKDIQAIAKHVKVDEANSRYIVMFLFMDDSNDEYTTDNQELWFPHPDGNYLAFTQTQTFEKTADEPLPLRWEIYLPYSVDELNGQTI